MAAAIHSNHQQMEYDQGQQAEAHQIGLSFEAANGTVGMSPARHPSDYSGVPGHSANATSIPMRRSYAHTNESFLNFRKLESRALIKYMEHHGLTTPPNGSPEELADIVTRHFHSEPVDEDQVLHNFFQSGMSAAHTHQSLNRFEKKRKRTPLGEQNGHVITQPVSPPEGDRGSLRGVREREARTNHIAKPNEEVAVRYTHAEQPEDTWILARIIKYTPETQVYNLRDEDDHTKVFHSSLDSVIRLDENNLRDVDKNDQVLAVFPDTTSFYRATLAKPPKRPATNTGPYEVIVRFEDDEDQTGRTPCRRVPARHILRLPQVDNREGGGDQYSDGGRSGDGTAARGLARSSKTQKDYKNMISYALQKLPANKGTLKEIFRIIENDFRDDLEWRLEGDGRKAPMWKNLVRKLLVNPRSGFMFINAGEKAYYSQSYSGDDL